jgi:hypothetical protein
MYRGFDSFYGFWGSKTDYWNHSSYENDYWGIDMRDNMDVSNINMLTNVHLCDVPSLASMHYSKIPGHCICNIVQQPSLSDHILYID